MAVGSPGEVLIDGRFVGRTRLASGVGRYTQHLIRGLATTGSYPVRIVSDERDGVAARIVRGASASASLAIRRPIFRDNALAWQELAVGAEARRPGIGLLHSPGFGVPLLCDRPTISTIHDLSFEAHPEWFSARHRFTFRTLVRRSVRRSQLLLADSDFTKSELVNRYGVDESRIRVVPCGIEDVFAEPAKADDQQTVTELLGDGRPFFLHVGQAHPRRRLDLLIRAFAKAKRSVGEARLVLVGASDPLGINIPEFSNQFGVGSDVIQLTHQPDAVISRLYRVCLAFIYPSVYEGFGIPLAEAMASGAPVAYASIGASVEVAGGVGLAFRPDNLDDIAAMLEYLSNEPGLRSRLGAAGKARAGAFDWRHVAERCGVAYGSILGSPAEDQS